MKVLVSTLLHIYLFTVAVPALCIAHLLNLARWQQRVQEEVWFQASLLNYRYIQLKTMSVALGELQGT